MPRYVQIEVAHKFATPKTLVQQYLFIPAKHKDCYLAYVLNEFAGQSTIVFVSTCNNAQVPSYLSSTGRSGTAAASVFYASGLVYTCFVRDFHSRFDRGVLEI